MDEPISLAGGWRTTHEAEVAFWETLPDDPRLLACTHFVPDVGEVAVSAQRDDVALVEGGRAFAFPGIEDLIDQLPVQQVLAVSAIDRVVALGGDDVAGHVVLDTGGFVRPTVRDGVLVLHVRPAAGGLVIPFERPNPTPCCADHA